ncbi:MAG: hypothetical protein KTR32_13800 [Granulosicoccus sp.]|nr:hypothetical protein [Granulosicoccus sp.]
MKTLLIAAFGFIALAGPAHAVGSVNLCEGLFTSKDRVEVPAVNKPPFMKYYREPAFGTRVIRITNSKKGEVHKPAYSTMQAWNADESYLLLYRGGNDSGHVLLDGRSYKTIRELDIVPSDIEEVLWSHTDPDVFYYVSKYSRNYGSFKKYSVKADRSTVIRSFHDLCGKKGLPTNGNDPMMQSMDDDLFGFRCQLSDDSYQMFTYRPSTDEVISQGLSESAGWEPWTAPIPGPSGKQLWLQGSVLDPDLKTVKLKHDMAKFSEHGSIGLTHDGQDAVFQVVFDPSPNGCNEDLWQGVGHLVVHSMETGECRSVVSEAKGYPYTTSGTHVSALAHKRPGWVAMSSVGYGSFEFFTSKRKAPALFSEIYLVNTDPDNEVVCRLAHHRSYSKDAKRASYRPYLGEPHATISPSGTRILFGSDWYDSGAVDAYVIELPAYRAAN